MYYLQSRYYDAEIGRFINADDVNLIPTMQVGIKGTNLFEYCNNNPIRNQDSYGKWPIIIVRIVAGMASAAAVYLYRLYARYGYKWKKAKKHFRASKLVCAVLTGAVLALLGPYWRYLNRVLYPVIRISIIICYCMGCSAINCSFN